MTTLKTALIAAAAVAIGAAFASTPASAKTLSSARLAGNPGASPRLPSPPGILINNPGVSGGPGSFAPSLPSGGSGPRPHCPFQDLECTGWR